MDITINRGDSSTITEVISGLESLTGYEAKLYIATRNGTDVDNITGTINGLTVYYLFLNDDTRVYIPGKYKYETKLFRTESDIVYTPMQGNFIVKNVIEENPS